MTELTKPLLKLRLSKNPDIRLKDFDPDETGYVGAEDQARAGFASDIEAIDALQEKLYAERKRALLVVLQGMDTAGKDSTIAAVFREVGPTGARVSDFKAPSEEERDHDYLWRIHAACPRRGIIGIFNRSHYEDVLIGRVRKLAPADALEDRYDQINDFEKMLVQNGTEVLKFMLHISKKEQGKRLQSRLDEPKKNWKWNAGDLADRALWDEYQNAYEIMLNRCSTKHAPWHVIPADHKWARNAAIGAFVREKLEQMGPSYPTFDWKPSDFKIT